MNRYEEENKMNQQILENYDSFLKNQLNDKRINNYNFDGNSKTRITPIFYAETLDF